MYADKNFVYMLIINGLIDKIVETHSCGAPGIDVKFSTNNIDVKWKCVSVGCIISGL